MAASAYSAPGKPTVVVAPTYKTYRATITQSGTNAPVANVIENTYDTEPVWSYNSVGTYELTFAAELVVNKTTVFIGQLGDGYNAVRTIKNADPNVVFVITWDSLGLNFVNGVINEPLSILIESKLP